MFRVAMPRRVLAPFALAALLSALVAGCGDEKAEDCFEQAGSLAQVTSDTLTVDHFFTSLSPDGTTVLFTSDHWVEELENSKESGERDIGVIELPAPGERRTPVPRVEAVGNAKRVVINDLPPDRGGQPFRAVGFNKGDLCWFPDGERFAATIQNDNRRERIYILRLPVPLPTGQTTVDASVDMLLDDVGLATAADDQVQYFYASPAVSPDGRWLAYTRYYYRERTLTDGTLEVFSERPAIYAYDLTSDPADPTVIRVTAGNTYEEDAAWSPDGQWIAFTSNGGRVGTNEVFKIRFDPTAVEPDLGGTDGRIRLTFSTFDQDLKLPQQSFGPFWARNGRIVFTSTRRPPCSSERRRNVWSMDSGGGDLRLVVYSVEDDHFVGGANFDTNLSVANDVILFSSRRNPVEDFRGQKDDIYMLRGGF